MTSARMNNGSVSFWVGGPSRKLFSNKHIGLDCSNTYRRNTKHDKTMKQGKIIHLLLSKNTHQNIHHPQQTTPLGLQQAKCLTQVIYLPKQHGMPNRMTMMGFQLIHNLPMVGKGQRSFSIVVAHLLTRFKIKLGPSFSNSLCFPKKLSATLC